MYPDRELKRREIEMTPVINGLRENLNFFHSSATRLLYRNRCTSVSFERGKASSIYHAERR